MKKILFLIHDLGQGGAEKVLVNLVNNMNTFKFDITVMTLFDIGENRQFLKPNIKYKSWCKKMFRGNSHLMKMFTPEQLHKLIIKEYYDIEVSYLEGPCARVISGCPNKTTKLVSWIHVEQHTMTRLAKSFRSESEAKRCYECFDQTICVSEFVKKDFCEILNFKKPCTVLYNTVESESILHASIESANEIIDDGKMKLVGVGSLKESKGFDRILRIVKRLTDEGQRVHLYILGKGPLFHEFEIFIQDNKLSDNVTMLGYQTNPYKYVSKCDLFVCASYAEGFSTAATEALIMGIPVCTVNVSGMKEMLGENNEYGIVVKNDEELLYEEIKSLLNDPTRLNHYRKMACIRGKEFKTEETVLAVEKMFFKL